ncbi:hypothetical protein K450DRAFT_282434 [Umbelopsis ramanniana AG]|uniref:SCP domain-containing protein n=1 Tax=Umbelopsis ramanniana AG TaxID=1314678 RepID=A0AAD5E5B4_UMBRA|nr:uncharacterized protein K450DRAFT_282434 [Umbelopsis ramanniana AG]KAI8577656.1 hypothetical protein K450DRAFT_282434 [Umbelopsis ramanniana AG]
MVSLSFIGLTLAVTALASQTADAATTKSNHHNASVAHSHKHHPTPEHHHQAREHHSAPHKRSSAKHTTHTTKKAATKKAATKKASKKSAHTTTKKTTKRSTKKITKKHTTAKTVTKAATSGSTSSDESTILSAHNAYRAKHSAPALKWNSTLASYAQKWSDGCVFQHSGGPYGENLAMGYGDWKSVVSAWYNEEKNYDYSKPGFSSSTGHFTQVVWVSTTQIGCGVKKCSNQGNAPIYTCSYAPPGNYLGEFEKNVLPN